MNIEHLSKTELAEAVEAETISREQAGSILIERALRTLEKRRARGTRLAERRTPKRKHPREGDSAQ